MVTRHMPPGCGLVYAALILNRFADSLDSAVARLRGIERPRYGFFPDQSTDMLAQFLFAMGVGVSGYMPMTIAATGLACFLTMSAQSLLRAEVTRTFHLAAGGMGSTKLRCLFFVLYALLYFVPPYPFEIGALTTTYAELLGVAWIVGTVLYATTMIAVMKRLTQAEPPRSPAKTD
jgi:archaetidylinositol phosphate synthase